MGKDGEGAEVSQSRKFGDVFSTLKPSQIRSSDGIHDGAKWQFCSRTQLPSTTAFSISAVAIGPWPWPSEVDSSFSM